MHGLGELEAVVMDILWRFDEEVRVREVLAELEDDDREPAYTTVMTVMDNLYRKGWLERERRGRAYWYRVTGTREEAAAEALRAVLDSTDDPAGALLQFVRTATAAEKRVLAKGLNERRRR